MSSGHIIPGIGKSKKEKARERLIHAECIVTEIPLF